ncbi:hypothetical protein ACP275_08G098800 [Erythranthe tilingii]
MHTTQFTTLIISLICCSRPPLTIRNQLRPLAQPQSSRPPPHLFHIRRPQPSSALLHNHHAQHHHHIFFRSAAHNPKRDFSTMNTIHSKVCILNTFNASPF